MQITGLHCTSSTKQHWLHGLSRSLTKYVRIQMKYFGLERIKRKTRGKNVSSNETKQKEKKKLTEAVSIEHIKIISTDYLVSAHCCCCWSLCISFICRLRWIFITVDSICIPVFGLITRVHSTLWRCWKWKLGMRHTDKRAQFECKRSASLACLFQIWYSLLNSINNNKTLKKYGKSHSE